MKVSKLVAGASVLVLSFGAAACGDDDDDDAVADDGTRFTSPADGAEVTSPVSVSMETDEIDIVAIDDSTPDDGHFHILVDVGCVDEGEPIPTDMEEEGYVHFGDGSTSGELELDPGDYNLCLQVGDPGHIAKTFTDEISITVTE